MLRILIGRSGSGKSHKCITEFNAYIQKNTSINNSSYLFVPEQYNMITERRLLEYQINENFAVKGLMGHEVLNFKRFVHRILSVYGQLNNVMLAYWYYYDNYHPSPPGGNIPIWLLFKIRDNNYFIM